MFSFTQSSVPILLYCYPYAVTPPSLLWTPSTWYVADSESFPGYGGRLWLVSPKSPVPWWAKLRVVIQVTLALGTTVTPIPHSTAL